MVTKNQQVVSEAIARTFDDEESDGMEIDVEDLIGGLESTSDE